MQTRPSITRADQTRSGIVQGGAVGWPVGMWKRPW
jgi:hypothetical protein